MPAPGRVPLPRLLVTVARMTPAMAVGVVVAALLIPNMATSAGTVTRTLRFVRADDAAVSPAHPRKRFGTRRWLKVGCPGEWRSYVRFRVRGVNGTVRRATLELHGVRQIRGPVLIRLAIGRRGWREARLRRKTAPHIG